MPYPENNIRIAVNNIVISCNDDGLVEAPVIIFIHGFPFNKSMWDQQVEALKSNYRVIAYDVRGHGESEAGNDDFSIDLFANDLMGLMDKLELNKVVLCGLSMGGYIALKAIEKYPHSFEALILSDTQCIADTPEGKEKRRKAIESIRKDGVGNYVDVIIKNLFAPESFIVRKNEVAAVRKMMPKTSPDSLCHTLRALAERKDTCGNLRHIKVPVLIMVGKEDKITPPTVARQMQEKIPGSVLSILDHAGHVSNIENPKEFNFQLEKFLQELYTQPSSLRVSYSRGHG